MLSLRKPNKSNVIRHSNLLNRRRPPAISLGLVLILVPWSEIWETNYFLYQYPALSFFVNNPFMRGAISGLGIMNVFLALEAFRRRAVSVASQG